MKTWFPFQTCLGLFLYNFSYWDTISDCKDEYELVFRILARNGSKYLVPSDFEPIIYGVFSLILDVVENHGGIVFLRGDSMQTFRQRYVETVIARLYFQKRNSCTLKMSLVEFRNTKFLSILELISKTTDINAAWPTLIPVSHDFFVQAFLCHILQILGT